MEAIMRLICGKVDKLETWMTEISFGMTEMDLKLRNIAHNIEGTAANVDDDATSVYRWAAPPPDDPEPSLVTVKLKVGGTNKKSNMKMTGMVASIIDTLGAPADERDDVMLSGHKKKTSVVNVGKKTHKKKHHSHQNEHDSVVSQSHDDKRAETVPSKVSLAVPMAVEEPVVTTPSEVQSQAKTATPDTSPSRREIPSSDAPLNHDVGQQHDLERSVSDRDTDRSDNGGGGAVTADNAMRVEEESSPVMTDSVAEAAHSPALAEVQREVVASIVEAPMEYQQEQASDVAKAEATEVPPIETAVPRQVELVPEPIDVVMKPPASPETKPVTPSPAPMQSPAPSKASTSSYLSLPPQQGSTEMHAVIPRGEPVTKREDSSPTPPRTTTTENVSTMPQTQEQAAPVVAITATPSTPTLRKASGPPAQDTRKSLTRRKSSKLTSPKAQPPPATPSVPAVALVDSPDEPATTASSVAPSDLPSAATKEHEVTQARNDENNGKLDNDSSDDDDDSGSSSDSQDSSSDSENQDAEIKVSTTALRKQSKAPGASTMTRTITALEKLKKANMLTPEEEEELKQRAQQKWFKLKGHMKEKKKKDVANIMLKRKKNVFTVSARIELLEEKSKELYAMIKQLNNDLKTKVDRSENDVLQRQVHDINLSLQALDHKITHGSSPAMEKAAQLSRDLEQVRTSLSQQLEFVNDEIIATRHKMGVTSDEHRGQLEFLNHAFEKRVASLMEENDTKFRNLPDHAATFEAIKRALRKKADLKLLKEKL
uniref:Uncharacterized protein n=1 Tax=Globisporangium ultimum (strain ATCC 200006 / CBS 805.95 / DAOM BR144) TaxID=431595 RepID=K3WBA9_GLOUD